MALVFLPRGPVTPLVSAEPSSTNPPLSAVVPTFKSFGFSDEAAKLFEEMYTSFSTGAIGYEHPASLVRGEVTLAEALQGMV